MPDHDKPCAPANSLPSKKPLPDTPEAPPSLLPESLFRYPITRFCYRFYYTATTHKHRYPIAASVLITALYMAGQGVIANALLFAVGLYQVNQFIDSRMNGGDS